MSRKIDIIGSYKFQEDIFYEFSENGKTFFGTMSSCSDDFPSLLENIKPLFGIEKREFFYAKINGGRKVIYPAKIENDKIVYEVPVEQLKKEEITEELLEKIQKAFVFIDIFYLQGSSVKVRITSEMNISLYHDKVKKIAVKNSNYLSSNKILKMWFSEDKSFRKAYKKMKINLIDIEKITNDDCKYSWYSSFVYNRSLNIPN